MFDFEIMKSFTCVCMCLTQPGLKETSAGPCTVEHRQEKSMFFLTYEPREWRSLAANMQRERFDL